MKYLHFILLSIFLMACETKESTEQGNAIQLKASGLVAPVVISDTISALTYQVPEDGIYYLNLPFNQSIYDLEILQSNQQTCSISDALDLTCADAACTTEYNPVCSKKPNAGIVCITAPCPTDLYKTYGNQCASLSDNAHLALNSSCEGLEDELVFHQRPVIITNIALLDIFSDNFRLLQSNIEDDIVTVEFEFSGGCGSHRFTLFADEVFMESDPVQLSYVIAHDANDMCEGIITLEKEFDLLPIKEIFQRTYPQSTGAQSVSLGELGIYTFMLN